MGSDQPAVGLEDRQPSEEESVDGEAIMDMITARDSYKVLKRREVLRRSVPPSCTARLA